VAPDNELGADVFARLRQARSALTAEHGAYLDDDQFITALCDAVLDRSSSANEPTGRAKFQIAVTGSIFLFGARHVTWRSTAET